MGQNITTVLEGISGTATKMSKSMHEAAVKKDILQRQAKLEKSEIKVDMYFVFGDEIPLKKKDINVIHDVTPRKLWMEHMFLFNEIKKVFPDETYHPIEMYALKWQPEGISYRLFIPLDDPQLQEQVLILLSKMSKRNRKKILFHFAPRNPTLNVFAPYVHPSSLVSYKNRVEILNALCAKYLDGKISIDDLEITLASPIEVWKMTLFNLLPEDEQIYHTYLNDKPEVIITMKDVEKDYIEGKITLQEYADFKFVERKKKRDMEKLTYPLPYTFGTCIICGSKNGLINCPSCENLVCVECIERQFLNVETKEGSFLVMHRKYCLKLGALPPISPIIVQEPGYMRTLRASGRAVAIEKLLPKLRPVIRTTIDDDDFEDEEAAHQAELKRKKEQEELERRLREFPPELEKLQSSMQQREKRYEKHKKDIIEQQKKLDEPGHAEKYVERVQRLKNDAVESLLSSVLQPLLKIEQGIVDLQLHESRYATEILEDTRKMIEKTKALSQITSMTSFLQEVAQIEKKYAPPVVEIDVLNSTLIGSGSSGSGDGSGGGVSSNPSNEAENSEKKEKGGASQQETEVALDSNKNTSSDDAQS